MMRILPALLILAALQAAPSTDVYLVEVSGMKFGAPVNITNRQGYDNQPMFLPDGESLFYTSAREGRPHDIYKYTIASKRDVRVTDTPEGEYSATIMPGAQSFSVIRVEADSTQRLWKFPIDGGVPSLVLSDVKPVGYQAWADENTVAVFVLGNPPTLQIVDVRTGKAEIVERSIGRSLHRIPGQSRISFVHKISEQNWVIKSLDPRTLQSSTLVATIPRKEDYAWFPNGSIVMGNGSKLFLSMPGKDTGWREVADFAAAGVQDITRLAVSPRGDYLAFVAADGSF
jgi:hypothetical protein